MPILELTGVEAAARVHYRGLAHTKTRQWLSKANRMIYLLAHLRCNHSIAVARSGILHKLLPVAAGGAHYKGYLVAGIEGHVVCSNLCSLSEAFLLGRRWRIQVHFVLVEAFASFKDMHKMDPVKTAACYTLCCPLLTCNSLLCRLHRRMMSKLLFEAWNAHHLLLMAV